MRRDAPAGAPAGRLSGLTIRKATLADVPAIRAILAAHGNDGPVTAVDIVGPYLRHLIEHATALVTERAGVVVAYGAAIDAGVALHLADLFVRPDMLGQGIGRPLLEAVLGDARHRTTFASDDPRALPLYVRAGMLPRWPLVSLRGTGSRLAAAEPPISVETAAPTRFAALEHDWTGFDRAADHVFWGSQAAAEAFVVLETGTPVALAYARARQLDAARVIDRLVVRPGAEPVWPTLAAIRHAARGGEVLVGIAGTSPVLPALLAAGFRIIDSDQFMASEPDLVDPARLIPNGGML